MRGNHPLMAERIDDRAHPIAAELVRRWHGSGARLDRIGKDGIGIGDVEKKFDRGAAQGDR